MRNVLLYILPIAALLSCQAKKGKIISQKPQIPAEYRLLSDTAIHFQNGIYLLKGMPYSGYLLQFNENGCNRQLSLLNGKEEDWQYSCFLYGGLAEKRYYNLGEKDSIHTGYWENGRIRFEYHFKNGRYEGDCKEWYEGGQSFRHIYYVNNMDTRGKGWRENGKIYLNYIVKEGRRYGLFNSNLCYSLQNEQGDWTLARAN